MLPEQNGASVHPPLAPDSQITIQAMASIYTNIYIVVPEHESGIAGFYERLSIMAQP
jgi:hypothetical protein